jgi:hypothetical protein
MVKIGKQWLTLQAHQDRKNTLRVVEAIIFLTLLAVTTFLACWAWGEGL